MDRYDAIVVGGGPAGGAFAITLAAAGRSVAVLDRSSSPGLRVADVLQPEIRPTLVELGVWESFRSDGHLITPGMLSAWGQAEPVAQDHIRNCYGDGWHIDRRRFADMLLERAHAVGAKVLRATRVTRLTPLTDGPHNDQGWHVEAMIDGHRIAMNAAYIVEATGSAASLTRLPTATATIHDRLVAVLATVEPPRAGDRTDHRMLLEATENGWWYSAEAPRAGLMVAWMTAPEPTDRHADSLSERWHRELESAPHTRLRVPPTAAPRVRVVAAKSWLRRAAHGRWLAVGDAAAAYDPLSGQGVVTALRSGQDAAVAVVADQAGSKNALEGYADGVAEQFRRYLRLRREFYRREHRWPDSPFWQYRRAAPEGSAPR